MSIEQVGILVGVITGIVSLLSIVYLNCLKFAKVELNINDLKGISVKIAKIEVKVDTMWNFQVHRAEIEAVSKGLAIRNSPVFITKNAKSLMSSLKNELNIFYRKLDKNITHNDLMLEIEKKFGYILFNKICISNGLNNGECLLIAAEVAKDID